MFKRSPVFFQNIASLFTGILRRGHIPLFISFIIVNILATVSLSNISFGSKLDIPLPQSDSYFETESLVESIFPQSKFLVLSIDIPKTEHAQESGMNQWVDSSDAVKRALQDQFPFFTIVTILDLPEIMIADYELRFYQGIDVIDSYGAEKYQSRLITTPLYSDLFIAKDRSGVNCFLFYASNNDLEPYIDDLISFCREFQEYNINVFGMPVLEKLILQGFTRELMILGICSMLIVFIIDFFITRNILQGLILWMFSLLPTIWCISLFPFFNMKVEISNILLIFIVFSLSTTYSIHLYRHWAGAGMGNMEESLQKTLPVIVMASLTTIFGFLSFVFSPMEMLRNMGILIIIGITFASTASLIFLPSFLALTASGNSKTMPHRGKKETVLQRNLLNRISIKMNALPFIFVVLIGILGFGISRMDIDYRLDTRFANRSSLSRIIKQGYTKIGGLDDLDVVIDFQTEYGFIQPETFQKVQHLVDSVYALDHVTMVFSILDWVSWTNGRLQGSIQPIPPENEYEIGECLELLSMNDASFSIYSLIDSGYSRIKLQIRMGEYGLSLKESRTLISNIQTIISTFEKDNPQWKINVTGTPVRVQKMMDYLNDSVFRALITFFPIIIVLYLFIFRSFRITIIALIPPVCGLITHLGLLGWFGIPLSAPTILTAGAILGVTNDDVLCFILFYMRNSAGDNGNTKIIKQTLNETGLAIVFTTAIIFLGFLPLWFSEYTLIFKTTIVTSISFIMSTVITLFIVPKIIRLTIKDRFDGNSNTFEKF